MNKTAVDKIGSAATPARPERSVIVSTVRRPASSGDLVVVKANSESLTYGNLELPSGRLAKINAGDVLLGVIGERRALKGFVGTVPPSVGSGDQLHLLNMGGVIGRCEGHHSSHSDAIGVEVIGFVCDEFGATINIGDHALPACGELDISVPVIVVAGSCMNSGKTVAAVEIIRRAVNSGLRVAGAKLTGVACLRDTLNMEDHGAFVTASFLDCGLPSTVGFGDIAPYAKGILNHLASVGPELIVVELGDGIVGGYGVDSILRDRAFKNAVTSLVFCASDYVGVIGGQEVLKGFGLSIDVIAGSVTDSRMGEDFITERLGLAAGNARRDGERLFQLTQKIAIKELALA